MLVVRWWVNSAKVLGRGVSVFGFCRVLGGLCPGGRGGKEGWIFVFGKNVRRK